MTQVLDMKKTFFTHDRYFYKTLIALAIPMMLQNLVTFSVGLADNLMIGSLGDSAVSGVYIGGQLQTILQVISYGIECVMLLMSAQYWGTRNTDSIRRITSIGLWISFGLGMTFTVVCAVLPEQIIRIFTKAEEEAVIARGTEYLSIVCFSFVFFCLTQALISSMRSVESARIGLIVSIASLVSNVVLNYILIFGKLGLPALGVRGAAIATLISRIIETSIIAIYARFFDRKLEFRLKHLRYFDRTLFKDFVRYGVPIMGGQIVWGINLMSNSIILGHFSEAVITATSLANTLNSLMLVGMNGISGAIGIIIGKEVGSGDLSRIREYARTTQVILLSLGLFTGGIFFFIRDPFISLYNISEEAVRYSHQFLTVICVTSIGTCYQAGSLFGLIKSGGDVSFVFRNDTIFVFGVVLPSAIITMLCGCPPVVVFACLKCDQILKCIPAFFKIRRYNWMKNLTREKVKEN